MDIFFNGPLFHGFIIIIFTAFSIYKQKINGYFRWKVFP